MIRPAGATPLDEADTEADLLAAEYVLGVLPLNQRVTTEARAKADPAFAALVRDWEMRLSPLNHGFPEIPAPDLLPDLLKRLAPPSSRRTALRPAALALPIILALLLAVLSIALFLAA